MATLSAQAITVLIDEARRGDQNALNRLLPEVYAELRRIAARHMRHEQPGQTLQATALVHEAYLRLFKDSALSFQNRAHFLAIAAQSMREILVDHARGRHAAKRGGGGRKITLDESLAIGAETPVDFLALHEALVRFGEVAPQPARIVELRFFGGLTNEEIAEAVGSSPATVKRHWSVARAWLYRELTTGHHKTQADS